MTAADIAKAWLTAFNAHDVDALLALYADDCRHTSPKIRAQFPETGGALFGKPALRNWWALAFRELPSLRYQMTALTTQTDRAVLEYLRHLPGSASLPVSESFDLKDQQIVASRVYHG